MYKFVGNENDVISFYNTHIKNLDGGFLILPLARRKYYKALSDSQINMSTRIVYNDSNFLNELQRYEVALGLYKDDNGPIPNDAFGIYLSVNPMDELEAFFSFQKDMMDRIKLTLNGNEKPKRIMSLFKSHMHKTVLQLYLKLDVDTKDAKNIQLLIDFFNKHKIEPHLIIETRGGYHILLSSQKLGKTHSDLYQFAKEQKEWITIEKNGMVVIPGTWQGGFLTRLLPFELFELKRIN